MFQSSFDVEPQNDSDPFHTIAKRTASEQNQENSVEAILAHVLHHGPHHLQNDMKINNITPLLNSIIQQASTILNEIFQTHKIVKEK